MWMYLLIFIAAALFGFVYGKKAHLKQLGNILLQQGMPLLYRRVRVARKSVMFLSETSLIADSMTVKDALLNEEINVFFKLYGHESHGGKCIIETQNVLDNHYAIKRCLTFYYNIL